MITEENIPPEKLVLSVEKANEVLSSKDNLDKISPQISNQYLSEEDIDIDSVDNFDDIQFKAPSARAG